MSCFLTFFPLVFVLGMPGYCDTVVELDMKKAMEGIYLGSH